MEQEQVMAVVAVVVVQSYSSYCWASLRTDRWTVVG